MPEVIDVPLADVRIPTEYHQGVHQRHVELIITAFDPKLLGRITVNKREDGYVVIDGVQRVEAARTLGRKTMEAWAFEGLDTASEARVFLDANMARKRSR